MQVKETRALPAAKHVFHEHEILLPLPLSFIYSLFRSFIHSATVSGALTARPCSHPWEHSSEPHTHSPGTRVALWLAFQGGPQPARETNEINLVVGIREDEKAENRRGSCCVRREQHFK